MIIKNYFQIATTPERKKLLKILETGYQAIQINRILKKEIKRKGNKLIVQNKTFNLEKFERIAIVGIGKCALETGKYLEKILGKRIWNGIVLDLKSEKLRYIQSIKGDHPVPSKKNIAASYKILRLVDSLNPFTDLLIFIVSGGGSSLFCLPKGIKLKDMINLTSDLHKSGANIVELNCVRKHLSQVQGGNLAKRIFPLKTIALYFSDVPGDNMRIIASGPLYPDNQTIKHAQNILQKYDLWNKYKDKIEHFSETIKQKRYFSNISHFLLLTNRTALTAMKEKAKQFKIPTKILSAAFQSYANQTYKKIKQLVINLSVPSNNTQSFLFLLGGETTVRVTGKGKGGRNQEAVLGALRYIKDNELFLSAASDGVDNTEYAGAIADKQTKQKAEAKGLDVNTYLENNNSFSFFKMTGDYIKTGPTGSNVADFILFFTTNSRIKKQK